MNEDVAVTIAVLHDQGWHDLALAAMARTETEAARAQIRALFEEIDREW